MKPTNIAPELADADALFRQHYRYILACAHRRIEKAAPSDPAIGVDDLAQETALAVYRGRGYFRPERGRLTTWLARMTSRTAFAIRKSVRSAKRTAPAGSGKSGCCARNVNVASDSGDFWNAVDQILTTQEAKAIALRFTEGLGTEEIGRRLGFRGAAKTLRAFASTLINNALKKLHRRRFDLRRAAGLG